MPGQFPGLRLTGWRPLNQLDSACCECRSDATRHPLFGIFAVLSAGNSVRSRCRRVRCRLRPWAVRVQPLPRTAFPAGDSWNCPPGGVQKTARRPARAPEPPKTIPRGFLDVPKRLLDGAQDDPREPQGAQGSHLKAPRRSHAAQEGPRDPQEEKILRGHPEAPNISQEGPNVACRQFERAPKRHRRPQHCRIGTVEFVRIRLVIVMEKE